MTAKQVWEGMLTELSKVNAPSMLLQDFNYFFNKAINQYINKRYNIYDINQQTTDDLRVLKSTAILEPQQVEKYGTITSNALSQYAAGSAKIFGATYETVMPADYLHLLNCICIYRVNKNFKCYNSGDYVQFAAKRLTSDTWSIIINDYYNRPLPWRPYYYIHNVNTKTNTPTNPIETNSKLGVDIGTDMTGAYQVGPTTTEYYLTKLVGSYAAGTRVYVKDGKVYANSSYTTLINNVSVNDLSTRVVAGESNNSNLPRTLQLGSPDNRIVSTVERDAGTRYGNSSSVRMEIRYGSDSSVFKLEKVFVDYIKAPQVIRLTQEQVDLTEDTSQIMEFPDYVCQEIINELTTLVMENIADPRLNTNNIVTQSIANPAQQQTAQPQVKG